MKPNDLDAEPARDLLASFDTARRPNRPQTQRFRVVSPFVERDDETALPGGEPAAVSGPETGDA